MENRKIQRVNSDIYRVLSVAINEKLNDGDIYGVDVLSVSVGADLGEAKVYIALSANDPEEQQRVFNALRSAGSYLRGEVAAGLNLKHTPRLRFILDRGRENAERVEELLKIINKTENPK
jgi:ribosome-binding factor A